jgi:GNAT superfamily N-acetyltransferase
MLANPGLAAGWSWKGCEGFLLAFVGVGVPKMSEHDLRTLIDLRPVGVDQLSDVRYVQSSAFRILAGHDYSAEEVGAFNDHVYSVGYIDLIHRLHLFGAYIGDELVATSAWCPANDVGEVARITAVFVRPLFNRAGIGTALVRYAEAQAFAHGFTAFSTRAILTSLGFFEQLGYAAASHGVVPLTPSLSLRVAFMRRGGVEKDAKREVTAGDLALAGERVSATTADRTIR